MKQLPPACLDNTYTYISRKDEWFQEGTECKLVANCEYAGIFKGDILVTEEHGSYWVDNHGIGNIAKDDEELCPWDEFDIYDKDGNEIEVI